MQDWHPSLKRTTYETSTHRAPLEVSEHGPHLCMYVATKRSAGQHKRFSQLEKRDKPSPFVLPSLGLQVITPRDPNVECSRIACRVEIIENSVSLY
jgi:hypothetical protein